MEKTTCGYISVDTVVITKVKVEVHFSTSHTDLFRCNKFYSIYNQDVERTPLSIAVIPFLANILPIAWLANLTIYIDELDLAFYEHIVNIRHGYEKMYPKLNFDGHLVIGKLVDNKWENNKYGLLFSGGVDAFASLVAHADQHPDLITVQGSDIHLDEMDAWHRVLKQNKLVCHDFGVHQFTIQSNYCQFLNYGELQNLIIESGENWWHGFQHGIGLIGQTAPLAYNRYSIVYIASSYTATDQVTCASAPEIDNNVHFGSCGVIHDQYEFNRIEKTQHIAQYALAKGITPYLRDCFMSSDGHNCNRCEKCIRSAAAIALLGYNPQDFGFASSEKIFHNSRIKVLSQIAPTAIPLWEDIKAVALKKNINPGGMHINNLKWLIQCDLGKGMTSFPIRCIRFLRRKFPKLIKTLDL